MKKLIIAAALLLGLSTPALAQQDTTFAASHLQAAGEFVDLLRMDRSLRNGIEIMLEAQMAANPQMREVESVVRDFMGRYMRWEDLRPEFMHLYAGLFTEGDLRQMSAFYSTPVGQKMIENEPEITRRAGEIGQARVMENLPELMRMLTEKMQRDAQPPGSR